MSDLKLAFASSAALTLTLNSLASSASAGRQSTVVDNSTNNYIDALVTVITKVSTGTIASDKCCYVYAYGSEDGTNYTADGGTNDISGSDGAYDFQDPTNLKLIGIVPMMAQSKTYKGVFSVAAAFGGILPRKWGLVVRNYCGITLDSSGNSASYTGVYKTVA